MPRIAVPHHRCPAIQALHHRHHNPWVLAGSICARRMGGTRHTSAALPHAGVLAVAPICFTRECAAEADSAFLLSVALPMAAAIAAAAYVARPPPQALKDSGQVFEDDSTGAVFEAPPATEEGAVGEPERDKNGLLVFRPISYTPWPVTPDYEGERLRIDVGPIKERTPRTFVFAKTLPQPSQLVLVTLPRPMGVVFEWDARRKRAFVAGVVAGSVAEQRRKQAQLNRALLKDSVQDGDVLRAVTATNFVYPTRALLGAVPPERHVVVYGADKQVWSRVRNALRKGEARDGSVTLVLERRADAAVGAALGSSSSRSSSRGASSGSG